MKRSCHGYIVQGGGTKSHVDLVRTDTFQACEFHEYVLMFNKLKTIFTNEN